MNEETYYVRNFTMPGWHPFEPQADITLQEVVELLKRLDMRVSTEVYEKLSGNIKRHFSKAQQAPVILTGPDNPEDEAKSL